ncbi:TonB-dependent siderophore receptor [Pseudothauera rhizosphaerae]|uniref:Secretin/TonB short N-terminal domain-containing protein n=1 Tax=Pseudothauera rhizosphaerae TaxID=2565932 RepID=A0A4S4ARQ0_9RHOO|nr:TonB-dependent receptor [Pseudothauera rhizosphaerae]THF62053.1 hypothetical protein E6O51_07790 [Pseudothauera rhizosphaerae]
MQVHRSANLPAARRLTPIAHALLWLSAGALGWASPDAAWAQNAPAAAQAQAQHGFDIPPGPLDQALGRFGRQSGAQIVVDANLTAGLHSPGLSGSHTVLQGLNRLLAGTGLQPVLTAEGEYTLRPIPVATGDKVLGAVHVVANFEPTAAEDAATNYTVRRSSNATKLDLSIKETPQSLSIITQKQIEEQNLGNVAEVLDATPGVTVNQYGPAGAGAAQYYSRGYQINSMQIDGMPTGISSAGGIDLLAGSDTAIYERVEIIRGSTGLTTGVGDPSASVNFVRKRPTYEPQYSARASYGRWDRRRAEVDVSTPFNESGSLRGRVVAAYQEGDSWVDRVSERSKVLYGVVEADLLQDTTLTLGGTYSFRRVDDAALHGASYWSTATNAYEGIDFGRSFNAATDWSYAEQENQNFFIGLEHHFNDDWKINVNYQYTEVEADRKYGILGADQGYNPATQEYYYLINRTAPENELKNLDIYLSGKFQLFGRDAQLVVGANGYKGETFSPNYFNLQNRYNWNWITLEQWNNGNIPINAAYPTRPDGYPTKYPLEKYLTYYNYRTTHYGGFLSTKFSPVERTTVILGTRYIVWKDETEYCQNDGKHTTPPYKITYVCPGYGADFFNFEEDGKFVPYAGLIYDITPNTSAYISYTGIFQPHDATDAAYAYDPGSARGYKPLDAKTGNTVELGVKSALRDNTLNLHAAVFRMKEKNIACNDSTIYRDENGNQITHPDGGVWTKNCEGPTVNGAELSIAGQVTPKWLINAGYTYLHADPVDVSGVGSALSTVGIDSNATVFPKHALKFFTSYRFTDKLTLGGGMNFKYKTELSSNDSMAWTGEQGRIWADKLSHGSYAVVDLMARYAIDKHFTVGLNAGNIFDREYRVNNRGSYYGTPRNVTVSLLAKF